MDIVVDGPLGGLFLCTVPPDTTIRVTSQEDFLLEQPGGKQSKELTTTEKSGHVFLKGEFTIAKAKPKKREKTLNISGTNKIGDGDISLSVNGKEVILRTKIDEGAISHS